MVPLNRSNPEILPEIKALKHVRTYMYCDGDIISKYETRGGTPWLVMWNDMDRKSDPIHNRHFYLEMDPSIMTTLEESHTPLLEIIKQAKTIVAFDEFISNRTVVKHETAIFTIEEYLEKFKDSLPKVGTILDIEI